MTIPKQRHPFCKTDRCSICLADAENLEKYLLEKIGLKKRTIDLLADYRNWLDKNNIPAETEYGWPRPEVFMEENINKYIASWKD